MRKSGVWIPKSGISYSFLGSLKQPRRRRQQKPNKFAYLKVKNSIFARFARAYFIFRHFEGVLVLSTTWNDLFCSCVDDVSIWWQMINVVCLSPKRWFQFNSRIVRTHFSSLMTLNNWNMIIETRSYIFRWRSCFRRRRVCLSSLMSSQTETTTKKSTNAKIILNQVKQEMFACVGGGGGVLSFFLSLIYVMFFFLSRRSQKLR